MTFGVPGLGPRHYVREDIEVPNPSDDKSESCGLIFCCRVICFRVINGFWRRGQVYFCREVENFFAVYIQHPWLKVDAMKVLIFQDIDATRFPLPDPCSFHACAYAHDRSTKRLASLQHPAHPLFRRNMHQHHNTPVKQHMKR
jgi:hypothetical protein